MIRTVYRFARATGKSRTVALWVALLWALGAGTGCGTTALDAVNRAEVRWYNASGLREHPDARKPIVIDMHGYFECGIQTVTGCMIRNADLIMIDVRRPVAEVDRTATHELGHRWGLEDGGPGIMGAQQSTPWSYCITQYDLDTLCMLYSCPWQRPECGP